MMSFFVRVFNVKALKENKIEGGSAEWVEVLMKNLQCRFDVMSVCRFVGLSVCRPAGW